ncbi:hypothetical protein HK100_010619, partial [Physocladia obscura]
MQRATNSKQLEKVLADMIDSIITTLPEDFHQLLQNPEFKLKIPRNAYYECFYSSDVFDATLSVDSYASQLNSLLPQYSLQTARLLTTMGSVNMHKIDPHNFTCAKGKSGAKRCRMGCPFGIK